MPHADIKYSPNLRFEPQKVFAAIEDTINAHDSDAQVTVNVDLTPPKTAITPIC